MKYVRKKFLASLLFVVMIMTNFQTTKNGIAHASSIISTNAETKENYITTRDFVKKLITAMKLEVVEESEKYIKAALSAGILVQGDVASYEGNITREECAVILNRADEYLHGKDSLEETYVDRILDKRISDIEKISKDKRKAVAEIYGKGIMIGYSNGLGVQNREFRGDQNVEVKKAKTYIDLTINSKKRYKLSPDGQVIRTTNLPKNADKFEYILECFPNEFYEKEFDMERCTMSPNCKEGDFYDYPVNMRKRQFKNWWTSYPMDEQMDKYLYDWAERMEEYISHIFNVSYKTIGKEWCKKYKEIAFNTYMMDEYLENYVKVMKHYKTTVKTRKIAAEPSTFYCCGDFYMRVYVEFMITANQLQKDKGCYIFCGSGYMPKLKLGEWITAYFDINLTTTDGCNGDGSTLRPNLSYLISK